MMKQSQVETANKQLLARYDRIEMSNKQLIEENAVLKNQIAFMERAIADLEVHKQRSAYNKELEEKVYFLDLRIKKAEE